MVNRRAFLSLFLAMLFLLGCQPKEVRYIPYYNERFGFYLVYPYFMEEKE